MRARFWRNKNARLLTRVNAVVETSERISQSLQAPPSRVEIDTSYLAAQTDSDEVRAETATGTTGRGEDVRFEAYPAQASRLGAALPAEPATDHRAADIEGQPDTAFEADELRELAELLEAEAVREQTARIAAEAERDAAEQRAGTAQHQLAELKRNQQQELAELREALRSQEQVGRHEAQAQREFTARLEAKALHEQAARLDLESRLAEVSRVAAETENELAALMLAASEREATARCAGQAERQHEVERLAASHRREQAARIEAEARSDRAEQRATLAERELDALRQAIEQRDLAARRDAERSQIDGAAHLQAAIEHERFARLEVEAERDAAVKHVADLKHELARVQSAARQRDFDAEERHREAVRHLEAVNQRADAARSDALAQSEVDARRVMDAERELATLRQAADQEKQAARRADEARDSAVALRQQAEADCEQAVGRAIEAERSLAALRQSAEERELDADHLAVAEQAEVAHQPPAEVVPPMTASESEPAAVRPTVRHSSPASALKARLQKAAGMRPSNSRAAPAPAIAVDRAAAALSQVDAAPEISPPDPTLTVVANDALVLAGSSDHRRDRRVESRMTASLWREGMTQGLACTVLDRSSSGARLEFRPDKYTDGITEFVVGNKLTLTLSAAQERTLVACVVVWIAGSRCGVQFAGQFRTQSVAPRKSIRMAAPEKASGVKAALPKFLSGRTAKSAR